MQAPVRFRPATAADITQLNLLINSAYRGDEAKKGWTTEAGFIEGLRTFPEHLKEVIETPNSSIYVVETVENCHLGGIDLTKNSIVGCVELKKDASAVYLGMLTVWPKLQGGGVGKYMLQNSEHVAKQWGCDKIHMTVIDIRTELIAWYVRHGYSRPGIFKPFHNDPRFGTPTRNICFEVLEKKL